MASASTPPTAKVAEEALRTSKDRLEAGTELAGLGYYEVDFGGPSVSPITGFTRSAGFPQVSTQVSSHCSSGSTTCILTTANTYWTRGVSCRTAVAERLAIEYRYLHPANGSRWIEHEARVAARDATGRAVRTFGVVRDITERKQMQEASGKRGSQPGHVRAGRAGRRPCRNDGRFLRVNDKTLRHRPLPARRTAAADLQGDITTPMTWETDLNCVRQVLSGEIESYSMEKRYFPQRPVPGVGQPDRLARAVRRGGTPVLHLGGRGHHRAQADGDGTALPGRAL